jgi:hypothetical protein
MVAVPFHARQTCLAIHRAPPTNESSWWACSKPIWLANNASIGPYASLPASVAVLFRLVVEDADLHLFAL